MLCRYLKIRGIIPEYIFAQDGTLHFMVNLEPRQAAFRFHQQGRKKTIAESGNRLLQLQPFERLRRSLAEGDPVGGSE